MIETQPVIAPQGRYDRTAVALAPHRAEAAGATIARDLSDGIFPAVQFYATQGEAGNIRATGTAWCRKYNRGRRISVYRTAPMDNPVGRAGQWEAVLVADMTSQVSPATAGDTPSRPGHRAGTASAARGDARTNTKEDA